MGGSKIPKLFIILFFGSIDNSQNVLLFHLLGNYANDLLYYNNKCYWIKGKRIKNSNTHGTGCTLSSAIACNLALNKDIKTAVINAKHYVSDCLSSHLNLGHGSGPIDHTCHIKGFVK